MTLSTKEKHDKYREEKNITITIVVFPARKLKGLDKHKQSTRVWHKEN